MDQCPPLWEKLQTVSPHLNQGDSCGGEGRERKIATLEMGPVLLHLKFAPCPLSGPKFSIMKRGSSDWSPASLWILPFLGWLVGLHKENGSPIFTYLLLLLSRFSRVRLYATP